MYKKQTFKPGQVLYAKDLNEMSNGIARALEKQKISAIDLEEYATNFTPNSDGEIIMNLYLDLGAYVIYNIKNAPANSWIDIRFDAVTDECSSFVLYLKSPSGIEPESYIRNNGGIIGYDYDDERCCRLRVKCSDIPILEDDGSDKTLYMHADEHIVYVFNSHGM